MFALKPIIALLLGTAAATVHAAAIVNRAAAVSARVPAAPEHSFDKNPISSSVPSRMPIPPAPTLVESKAGKRDAVHNQQCSASLDLLDQTSNTSPLASDCLVIASNIKNGGEWKFESGSHHQLVQFGTCAFGVETPGTPWGHELRIGNKDIIDAISESVTQFATGGKLNSLGYMYCYARALALPNRVKWGIYHNH